MYQIKNKRITLFMLGAFLSATGRAQISPDSALNLLKAGNHRFVSDSSLHPNQSKSRLKEVASGQKPFAVIVGCSDSRVPNEIIFDQGLGDLFIVRTAGQVSTYASWGSIEFAHKALGARLVVVLGHTKCGAVTAACKLPVVDGHIITLINAIKPAATLACRHEGDTLDNAVRLNVAMQVEQLRQLEPTLAGAVNSGDLEIVGAVYNLETGVVEWLPDNYLEAFRASLKTELTNKEDKQAGNLPKPSAGNTTKKKKGK